VVVAKPPFTFPPSFSFGFLSCTEHAVCYDRLKICRWVVSETTHAGPTKDRFVGTALGGFRLFTVQWEDYDSPKDPDWPDEGPWEFEPVHPDTAECRGGSELYHTHDEARRLASNRSRADLTGTGLLPRLTGKRWQLMGGI
jgi:hypothetical protein